MHSPLHHAYIGLRAKTARAIAVVLSGAGHSPQIETRVELTIDTGDRPALFQPYHEVMDLSWERATVAVQDFERAIEAAATRSLETFLLGLRKRGVEVPRLAIVGAPDRKLASIGSPHIRAHAAEGVLFRHVWQVAAEALGVPFSVFSEKDFESFAVARLKIPVAAFKARLAEFSREVGAPWRADEKAGAAAAWLALAAQGCPSRKN